MPFIVTLRIGVSVREHIDEPAADIKRVCVGVAIHIGLALALAVIMRLGLIDSKCELLDVRQ